MSIAKCRRVASNAAGLVEGLFADDTGRCALTGCREDSVPSRTLLRRRRVVGAVDGQGGNSDEPTIDSDENDSDEEDETPQWSQPFRGPH